MRSYFCNAEKIMAMSTLTQITPPTGATPSYPNLVLVWNEASWLEALPRPAHVVMCGLWV